MRWSCVYVAGLGGRRDRPRQVCWPYSIQPQAGPHRFAGHKWAESTHSRPQARTDRQKSTPKGWQRSGSTELAAACLLVGVTPTCLGSHNLARPCLVGSVGSQLGEHHLHGLKLLVLGWDGTYLIGHLIPFHGHVLPLDAGGEKRKDPAQYQTSARRPDTLRQFYLKL